MHEPLPHRSAPATGVARTPPRDYETRSNANLRKVGADKHAADPSTEVLCAAYAVDDGVETVRRIASARSEEVRLALRTVTDFQLATWATSTDDAGDRVLMELH